MNRKNHREENQRADMVSLSEEYEIKHIMENIGSMRQKVVKEAIRMVGNNREKGIEEYPATINEGIIDSSEGPRRIAVHPLRWVKKISSPIYKHTS